MNYQFFSMLLMATVLTGCAKPNIIMQSFESEQIFHYSQMKNIEDMSHSVVYLDKGDKIPLKVNLESKLLAIAHGEIHLILKKKVYLRWRIPKGITSHNAATMSEEEKEKFFKNLMIYLSPDAKRWAPYTDIKAVSQLFEIQGGSFSFGMGITKEGDIQMSLNGTTTGM